MSSLWARFSKRLRPAPARRVPIALLAAPVPALAAPPPPSLPAIVATLRTARGATLTAHAGRVEMAAHPATGEALIAIFPHANRQLCFVMAQDLHPIAIRADGLRAPAISAYRLQTDNPAAIRLRHPLTPIRYLAVTQHGQGAPDGLVIFDGLGNTRLDLFEPAPFDAALLSPPFLAAAAELCAATSRPYQAATLLTRLHDRIVRPAFTESLIRILPRDELPQLATALLENPADLDLLTRAMPDDPWAQRVLPELAAWRRDRTSVGPDNTLTSPPSDEFAGDPLEGYGQPQAGFALTALARAQLRPRHGPCLLAAARNEGPYLLDWLSYHFSIGFEHAFIYTNDNWDGSDALLSLLARHGVITLIHNQPGTHCGPQYKAYSHALTLLPQILDYGWVAVIDLDEFIGFDARLFSGITDYLAWQQTQPVDAIALCWQVFAGMRNDVWRDDSSLKRFTKREPHANAHVKSIFRPRLFWHSQAHYPNATLNAPFVFRTELGDLHHHQGEQRRQPAFAHAPTTQFAWVNHYLLRSAPEALWKLARGHGDWKGDIAERQLEMARFICRTFVTLAEKPDLVEDRRILGCAGGQAAALATLRALPGVADAEATLKANFTQRLTRMVHAFAASAPQPGEPIEFAPFRDLLRKQQIAAA
jgi:hypothetical protein